VAAPPPSKAPAIAQWVCGATTSHEAPERMRTSLIRAFVEARRATWRSVAGSVAVSPQARMSAHHIKPQQKVRDIP
jgi:hypothetical protein